MPYINKGLSSKICALIKDISGSAITIDNKFNDRLLSLKANIVAKQSGSGDPSPDNVRPIIGWDSVSVADMTEFGLDGWLVTINLGGTYYGGVLDVTNGVLNVTHDIVTYNGTENWTYRTQSDSVYHSQTGMKNGSYQNGKCDIFPIVNSFASFGCMLGTNNKTIYVNKIADLGLTNADEFKTWLTTHNMTVVYPLETPFDIQLTPTEVELLANQVNTIFADSGDIEAIYKTFTP